MRELSTPPRLSVEYKHDNDLCGALAGRFLYRLLLCFTDSDRGRGCGRMVQVSPSPLSPIFARVAIVSPRIYILGHSPGQTVVSISNTG